MTCFFFLKTKSIAVQGILRKNLVYLCDSEPIISSDPRQQKSGICYTLNSWHFVGKSDAPFHTYVQVFCILPLTHQQHLQWSRTKGEIVTIRLKFLFLLFILPLASGNIKGQNPIFSSLLLVIWEPSPCSLLRCIHTRVSMLILLVYPEDGGITFIRNFAILNQATACRIP
jgi:hypothetical protein